jgi:hypothetical protein
VVRLGAEDGISVRGLAALGLLGLRLAVLLAVLRIRWGVRHISLGYDDRKLGEEVFAGTTGFLLCARFGR